MGCSIPKLTLFHSPGACSLASLISFLEAELEHQVQFVDVRGPREEYRRINPSGRVPSLLIGDNLLTESCAILTYIARTSGKKGLLSDEAEPFCRQLSTMSWFASAMHITRRLIARPAAFSPDPDVQARLTAEARPVMWQHLTEMSERLRATGWFGGGEFSLVDGYAMVFYSWGVRDGFPVEDLPLMKDWKERMLSRPAVREAVARDVGPLSEQAKALQQAYGRPPPMNVGGVNDSATAARSAVRAGGGKGS